VHAVIFVESRYDSEARSPDGAVSLMQVQPNTASRYGVDDPAESVAHNLRAGTRYLRDLMKRFNGRLELVLAAYNAGEGAVIKHGEQIPPYKITQSYVPKVLEKYYEFRELLAQTHPDPHATIR
jgi:soluble lytic murein transglycosylase-like protein